MSRTRSPHLSPNRYSQRGPKNIPDPKGSLKSNKQQRVKARARLRKEWR